MKTLLSISLLLAMFGLEAQWKPAGDKIRSKWAQEVTPGNVLNEYPRPMMVRPDWKNLNGLWDFTIQNVGMSKPASFEGQILVPFPVESSLSGAMRQVGPGQEVWYQTTFEVPAPWKESRLLLHFGAVDWESDVWINDIKLGGHQGGYTPFSFDITPFLVNGSQKLTVRVWDPTDKGPQPRGKQVTGPEGIWYTPVTGIWQTVWIEPVGKRSIRNLKITPDIDRNFISVAVETEGTTYGDVVEVRILDKNELVASSLASFSEKATLVIPSPRLWSPEDPFLYDVEINLLSVGRKVDQVTSYAAMRKISAARDEKGIVRLQLNNRDYFQFGTLDQGWWPDGLYTAPSDEALAYDIRKTKDLGFNMIRKHVKVEPARWYTHCDRLGMLVWQDMPSGDDQPVWQNRTYFEGNELKRSPESERIYRREWKEIMDHLHSNPSIVIWVPFNEGWGQFKTQEITQWTQEYDPSRLVNAASGGNHFQAGDMLDLHNYPDPELYLYDGQRANVLGEYGGIGLALREHLWEPDRNWGYVQFKDSKAVTAEYLKYAEKLEALVKSGFSAAIYTQTTDVETEVNGLMTYDRNVIKVNEQAVRKANQEVINVINNPKNK